MIVLDTNVISALMRPTPDPKIVEWLDGLDRRSLWLTSITVFEVRTGIELLPFGAKRRDLETRFAQALTIGFQGRVLPFDNQAAAEAAIVTARRRREGRAVEWRDTQIAGAVLARNARLATRNIKHFGDLGERVIDPWAA